MLRTQRVGRSQTAPTAGLANSFTRSMTAAMAEGIMNRIAKFVLACSILTLFAAQAYAHHSAAAFDTQKQVTVAGTVTQYRFGNPHIYVTLQVKRPDGS